METDIRIMTSRQDEMSQQLDQALDQSFPASDPPALAAPAGDARDVTGCRCNPASAQEAARPIGVEEKTSGCCGGKAQV